MSTQEENFSQVPGTPQTRVRGTQILATDTAQQYRRKLARIALDEMYQFVAVLDAEGTLLEVNRAALEGGGLQLSDVEGKPFWQCFWWGVSADIRDTLKAAIGRAAQGEFIRYDVEVYGRAGGKETIIIDFSMIPVKDDTGKVVFIVPEGRDITEKKAYEQQIAHKTADLQVLLERIRELDEIKTQFFANVSHELRTPLALIIGPAERLLKAESALSPEERREAAQVIVRNARMLLKHVNDLLDISKLEAGKLRIELQDTDVAALVRFVASHFEILAAERSVELRVEAPPSCIFAVDPEKLQRVVMNLLSNAFKFAPARGTIRCKLDTSRNELRLAVEDSGPGVKAELRAAIFERFRQGDGGANRQFSGTGLGLAIAQEFVQMHKGSLQVLDSDLGGALFQLTLPAHRLSASSTQESLPQQLDRSTLDGLIEELRLPNPTNPTVQPDSLVAGTKLKVLVVEDNVDMNRFVAQCLSDRYEVICGFDGQQGLEKALAFNPALIVADIMMPKVSGAEMISQLRKYPQMRDTPILLLSAKADEELKTRLLEEGAQDFITKPFTEADLLVRARNLIAVKQSHEALRAADRRKDEFLATLAHELRNPLAPIRHAAAIGKTPAATEPQLRWAHDVIDRQVAHMARLLDDLLEVSRITRGKLELRKVRLPLKDSLVAAVEAVRPLIEARKHQLTISVPSEAIVIDADPVRVAQIFSNLLTNAAKYTDPGGNIRVHAKVLEESVVVAILDDGIGIEAERLSQVFEMFSQVTSALERSQGGLGIGLSLVRGLVLLHGGSIEARSRGLGHGSEFIVTFPRPAAEIAAASASTPVDRSTTDRAALRVLLADDNRDSADSWSVLLQLAGLEVRCAYSGPEALQAAADFQPHLVLLDIGMPGMNGYEVARRIRAAAWGKNMVLAAVTGWGQAEDKRQALLAGFDQHLTKPVDLDALEPLFVRARATNPF